ncbi:TMEM134 [Bugula neritina]|uniref:TMEM134 n=1 Tax=Bugula neritina TaxID=10212 RepID=A0A7J7JMQ6_BUGNE|nr:TMEM134 [Bugula neritina]
MAEDYDDNILLDSDEESSNKAKKSKASNFIPKPRILTAPASNKEDVAQSAAEPEWSKGGSSQRHTSDALDADVVSGSPAGSSCRGSLSSSMPTVHVVEIENDAATPPAAVEPSEVHLVSHPVVPPSQTKAEESTYKRLISDSPSVDDQVDSEIERANTSCLCRVIKHPTIRKNWKVYLGSIVLTMLGLGLVILGVIIGYMTNYKDDLKYLLFIVGGLILLIPGSYHLIFMTLAAWDVPGFKFSKLPTLR